MTQQQRSFLPMQETGARSLGCEHPLEKEMVTHSNIRAWRIPWTEEPDGLQSMGSQRAGYSWATKQQQWSLIPLGQPNHFRISFPGIQANQCPMAQASSCSLQYWNAPAGECRPPGGSQALTKMHVGTRAWIHREEAASRSNGTWACLHLLPGLVFSTGCSRSTVSGIQSLTAAARGRSDSVPRTKRGWKKRIYSGLSTGNARQTARDGLFSRPWWPSTLPLRGVTPEGLHVLKGNFPSADTEAGCFRAELGWSSASLWALPRGTCRAVHFLTKLWRPSGARPSLLVWVSSPTPQGWNAHWLRLSPLFSRKGKLTFGLLTIQLKDKAGGNPLVVQWLGFHALTARARLQSLAGKLRLCRP